MRLALRSQISMLLCLAPAARRQPGRASQEEALPTSRFSGSRGCGRGRRGRNGSLLAALPDVVGWLDDGTYLENAGRSGDKQRRLYRRRTPPTARRESTGTTPRSKKHLPEGCDSSRPAARRRIYIRFIFEPDDDLYYFDYAASLSAA